MSVCVCVLAVYNKAQAQRISNREFKLWTFLQGTESKVATFLAEIFVMSHQSPFLCRQAKSKCESPTAVEFWSRTPKSDHFAIMHHLAFNLYLEKCVTAWSSMGYNQAWQVWVFEMFRHMFPPVNYKASCYVILFITFEIPCSCFHLISVMIFIIVSNMRLRIG